jgi:tetratricopeptide (TPR) repeat protein
MHMMNPLMNSDSAPARRPGMPVAVAALILASVLPYLNALHGGFVFDDKLLVVRHGAVTGAFRVWPILTAPYWEAIREALLWRPVTTLSFAIDWHLGGGGAAWFHAVNIGLHAIATLLWAWLVLRIARRGTLALVAGLLFAVHPIHTEAVTWISGRAELLAAVFGLAALHLAWSRRRWLTLPALLLAIGSKESAASLPLILLFLSFAFRGKREDAPPWRLGVLSFAPVFLYVILRRAVLGTWGGPSPDPMDNPMTGLGLFARLPTALDAAGRYLVLLLWPARLSVDYSAPVMGVVRSLTPQLLVGLAALAGLVHLAVRKRTEPAGWGAAFALSSFALASNIPVVIGTIFAERLLYLPSAGFLLIAACGGFALSRGRMSGRALQALLVVLLLAGAARSWTRNRDYLDEATMYAAGVRITPESPKMRFNHALALSRQGRHEEAVREGIEAIRLNPSSRESRDVVACSLDSLGRGDEAIRFLRRVLIEDPGDRVSRRRLIGLLERRGWIDAVDSIAVAGMRADPEEPEWVGRAAKAAQDRRDFGRAAELWREAMRRSPDTVDVPLYLAFCLLKNGDMLGARDAYREALRRSPESAAAANGLAWALLETGGSVDEAIRYAELATAKAPQSANGFDTLARAYETAGRCADAVRAEERAAELDPGSASYRERIAEIRRWCR